MAPPVIRCAGLLYCCVSVLLEKFGVGPLVLGHLSLSTLESKRKRYESGQKIRKKRPPPSTIFVLFLLPLRMPGGTKPLPITYPLIVGFM